MTPIISWVAEASEHIIGISGLVFFQKPPVEDNLMGLEAYIMNMYTLPEWRGQGVATALVQSILHYVQQTSARRIWLHTTEAGRHVYEQCGFVFSEGDMEITW